MLYGEPASIFEDMHKYFIKTPWWVKKIFSSYVWSIPTKSKTVHLTFDDGPHPVVTPWVLDELKKHNAKATFFCIGKNVVSHPEIYHRILREGHAVGNHTYHHLNGWKTSTDRYLDDVAAASKVIDTNLFRPPYGRIKRTQARGLHKAMKGERPIIVMWDVLSADFDMNIPAGQCAKNVLRNVSPGSVVDSHDSEKAFPALKNPLPTVLTNLKNEGYRFQEILMKRP